MPRFYGDLVACLNAYSLAPSPAIGRDMHQTAPVTSLGLLESVYLRVTLLLQRKPDPSFATPIRLEVVGQLDRSSQVSSLRPGRSGWRRYSPSIQPIVYEDYAIRTCFLLSLDVGC